MKTKIYPAIIVALVLIAGIAGAADSDAISGVVNINTADEASLQLLPRVGPALSGRIISFRETNGDFASVDELVAVKGIGEKSLAALKPYITVSGKTTLTEKVHLKRTKKKD